MPEPGMGANNDHKSTSIGASQRRGNSGSEKSTSSDSTTAEKLSSGSSTSDNLTRISTHSDNDIPTTAEALASSPTTAESLARGSTESHSYDEVPQVASALAEPAQLTLRSEDNITPADFPAQLPEGVPAEYAELFGVTPNPVGGVDAVWANGDGTFSSSDGTTYDPSTGEGTYDPGEDSFALTRTSSVVTLTGEIGSDIDVDAALVTRTERYRHPDRVRSSEALAVVQHDPNRFASTYGNSVAFDYYRNPNLDSVRDSALMQIANRTGEAIAGRYPGENFMYLGAVPATAHLARLSTRLTGASRSTETISSPTPGVINITRARFGHTFSNHGQGSTEFLTRRAAGSGRPQGQFLDDQAAARLIESNLHRLSQGAVSIPVPNGFPARVIMPDGTYVAPSSIRLVPGGNGVKTAYPDL